MLRYFPGMTPEFVQDGPDGEGVPWDWWTTACDLIDEYMKRGL